MDEKLRDRRRSVGRQRGRRRATVAVVVVLIVGALGVFMWLRSSDVFAVKRVTATATQHVGREEIAGLVSEALGESLLNLSTGPIKEGLLALPYVRSADVYRRFPDGLDLRLVEYEPVARLKGQDGAVWLIADDGRILERVDPPSGAGLPLVLYSGALHLVAGETVPETVQNALPMVELVGSGQSRAGLPAIDRLVVSPGGSLIAVLAGGTELRLGDSTDLDYKLRVAGQIMQRYLRDGKKVEYIDLTAVPERVAAKAG